MTENNEPRMVIEYCPQCHNELPSGGVTICPYCGTRLTRPGAAPGEQPAGQPPPGSTAWLQQNPYLFRQIYGYEYRSSITLWGLPLVHIAQGLDPNTGRPRIARGIIAIGNVAIGVLALGGLALGGVALGGLSVGVLALGGVAFGVAALGGMAGGVFLAVGGMAIAGQYALGGLALAPHAIGGNAQDPALLHWLEQHFGPMQGW